MRLSTKKISFFWLVSMVIGLFLTGPVQSQVTGDALVDATSGEPTNFIPALAADTASASVVAQVYRGLVKFDKDINLVPDLAESFEISDDQRTITFKLKSGIKWQDGTPFTSSDCLFTWELMRDPKTPTPYGENFIQIESASAPDPLTFVVTYKRPMAKALSTWGFDIMPRHLLEGADLDQSPLARQPVGTGPFVFGSWEAGQRVTLNYNENYFEGRPYLDRLITRVIPDPATQMMELNTGALDMMNLTPDQWVSAQEDQVLKDSFAFYKSTAFAYTYLGFNLTDARLSDKRVRQAIALAINQDEIIEGVLLGLGSPANGPFQPDMWANNKKVLPYPYEPERAKALLAEAGWKDVDGDGILEKDGQKFILNIVTNQGNKVREQTGLVIQSRLKQVGIEVKLTIIEWAAFLKEYLNKKNFEAIIMGWTIPMDPDLYDVWHSSKINPGEFNFITYNNPEVDSLIDVGRFSLDRETRKKAYDRVQEILYDEVPYVFLFVPDSLTAISKRFVGPDPAPVGLGYNLPKWYVPKDRQLYQQ